MSLFTQHNRREWEDHLAHLWGGPMKVPEKGDATLCGSPWRRGYGTLVSIKEAGLGGHIFEVFEHPRLCPECEEVARRQYNLSGRRG